MEEQIKQIAERLREMREVMDVTADEAAVTCDISKEQYIDYESGRIDIPVSILHRMSRKYKFDLTMLLSGEEPHMHSYTLTRKDKGVVIDRRQEYKYQSLAGNFLNRRGEPFLVTVEPKEDLSVRYNSHPGQEFNYVIDGKLRLFIGDKTMILNPGDSIYFDSGLPHGMMAEEGKTTKFLAVIL